MGGAASTEPGQASRICAPHRQCTALGACEEWKAVAGRRVRVICAAGLAPAHCYVGHAFRAIALHPAGPPG
jgi:hypothetical protein